MPSSVTVALDLCIRICCIGRLISAIELFWARSELQPGGLLDWRLMWTKSAPAHTGLVRTVNRLYLLLWRPRVFTTLIVVDCLISLSLLYRPYLPALLACAVVLQIIELRRLRFAIDGSDQMTLIVLAAAFCGQLDPTGVAGWAAVSFLAAEVCLAYWVSGSFKLYSPIWRSGRALSWIARTKAYGHRSFSSLINRYPFAAQASAYAIITFECGFVVSVISPRPILVVFLVGGVLFHIACSLIMGLNRFLWAFVATYPAVILINERLYGLLSLAAKLEIISVLFVIQTLALVIWQAHIAKRAGASHQIVAPTER